jgi:hypothetical protein
VRFVNARLLGDASVVLADEDSPLAEAGGGSTLLDLNPATC